MKEFIACLLLGVLLGMMPLQSPAQQNQNVQPLDSEVEALKKRVSELEEQLQTVENVEKMELQAKLADANTKLINAEFSKFERELRDSNHKWLTGWILFFLAILSAVGIGVWSWLKSRTNQLIETEVEKNLNGFKEAVDAQDTIKVQLRELRKEHAASVLEDFITLFLNEEHHHPEQIKALSEEDLLQVFEDERYRLELRYQAAKVLTVRKSLRLVSPLLAFLNSVINSDIDNNFTTEGILHGFVNLLGHIHTQETYQGLKKFLDRLLTEDSKHKDLFLMETVLSLAWVSIKLDIRDSVSILRRAMSHFETPGVQRLKRIG